MTNIRSKTLILSVVFGWGILASQADALTVAPNVEGIYSGTMHLNEGGVERDMPLSLSMNFSGDTINTPQGQQSVIISSFVIDQEGGPYAFTRVTFNLQNSEFEFFYSRPRQDPTTTAPAGLQLVGTLSGEGKISGRVVSGLTGQIGTFTVEHTDQAILPIVQKYSGIWVGTGSNMSTGALNEPMEVGLTTNSGSTLNPPTMELDYTPGHSGYLRYHNVVVGAFGYVAIDYLRHKVLMTDGTVNVAPSLTLTANLDFLKNTLQGVLDSALRGRTLEFTLQKALTTPVHPND